MKRILSALTLFFLCLSLFGKTTLSYRERKKQLDQKITILIDLRDTLGLEPNTYKISFDSLVKQVEETYRVGNRVEWEKTLNIAEGEIHLMQRKLCPDLDEKASSLFQKAMGDWIQRENEEKLQNKLTAWEDREKIQRYLSMAKNEKEHAKDYFVSGNYHLSLHTYKRSIVYSLMSLRAQRVEAPDDYQTANNLWVEPIWNQNHPKKESAIREN